LFPHEKDPNYVVPLTAEEEQQVRDYEEREKRNIQRQKASVERQEKAVKHRDVSHTEKQDFGRKSKIPLLEDIYKHRYDFVQGEYKLVTDSEAAYLGREEFWNELTIQDIQSAYNRDLNAAFHKDKAVGIIGHGKAYEDKINWVRHSQAADNLKIYLDKSISIKNIYANNEADRKKSQSPVREGATIVQKPATICPKYLNGQPCGVLVGDVVDCTFAHPDYSSNGTDLKANYEAKIREGLNKTTEKSIANGNFKRSVTPTPETQARLNKCPWEAKGLPCFGEFDKKEITLPNGKVLPFQKATCFKEHFVRKKDIPCQGFSCNRPYLQKTAQDHFNRKKCRLGHSHLASEDLNKGKKTVSIEEVRREKELEKEMDKLQKENDILRKRSQSMDSAINSIPTKNLEGLNTMNSLPVKGINEATQAAGYIEDYNGEFVSNCVVMKDFVYPFNHTLAIERFQEPFTVVFGCGKHKKDIPTGSYANYTDILSAKHKEVLDGITVSKKINTLIYPNTITSSGLDNWPDLLGIKLNYNVNGKTYEYEPPQLIREDLKFGEDLMVYRYRPDHEGHVSSVTPTSLGGKFTQVDKDRVAWGTYDSLPQDCGMGVYVLRGGTLFLAGFHTYAEFSPNKAGFVYFTPSLKTWVQLALKQPTF
jgi:hypothetical protein